MSDMNERPVASAGSAAKCRPIGAYVHTPTYDDLVAEIARLRLNKNEREAIAWCRDNLTAMAHTASAFAYIHAATLRGLLERLA